MTASSKGDESSKPSTILMKDTHTVLYLRFKTHLRGMRRESYTYMCVCVRARKKVKGRKLLEIKIDDIKVKPEQ